MSRCVERCAPPHNRVRVHVNLCSRHARQCARDTRQKAAILSFWSTLFLEHSVFGALCYGAKFPDGALGSLVVRRASCRSVARAPAGWRLQATARPKPKVRRVRVPRNGYPEADPIARAMHRTLHSAPPISGERGGFHDLVRCLGCMDPLPVATIRARSRRTNGVRVSNGSFSRAPLSAVPLGDFPCELLKLAPELPGAVLGPHGSVARSNNSKTTSFRRRFHSHSLLLLF